MARRKRPSRPRRHRCPPCSQRLGDLSIDLFKQRQRPAIDVPLAHERQPSAWAHQIDVPDRMKAPLTPLDPLMTRRRPNATLTIIAFIASGAAGYFLYRTFIEKKPKDIEKPENAGLPGQIAPGLTNYLAPPTNYVMAP